METIFPDYVTHYYLASRPPFLNLSDLGGKQLEGAIERLAREHASGATSRLFGRRYMELRRRTEEKLRSLFISAGGQPERLSPHYFVLGSCPWYRGLARDMREVTLPLAELPRDASSFTYPDSFTSMALGAEYGLHQDSRPYHEQVYSIEQLQEVIDQFGLPDGEVADYRGYQHQPFEKYVEVQLWSDVPVHSWLG